MDNDYVSVTEIAGDEVTQGKNRCQAYTVQERIGVDRVGSNLD